MSMFSEKAKQTSLRHKNMSCKTFELKIDKSKLSKIKLDYLNRLFLESKWLFNYILSSNNIFNFDTKSNKVIILNKDKQKEERELLNISSQMKQGVKEKLKDAIKSLSSKKKKNSLKKFKSKCNKIGKIKFTSKYTSILLPQCNITYRFIDKKYLKLQGCKLKFKISGLNQIPKNSEITCATLIHKHNDFYLKLTCFIEKEEQKDFKENCVGIDFGCIKTLTLSNKTSKQLKIKENLRLRRTSRRLKKRIKGSKNYFKQKNILNKEYHKLTNRKKDKKNKIVNEITKNFKIVIVQDENISAWHAGKHGKAVQNSLMSGIIRDLERKSHTFIKVDKFFPSSQLCYKCGNKKKMKEEVRTYKCEVCGYIEDRDINAAKNIEREGIRILNSGEAANIIPVERREFKTLEEKEPLLISHLDVKQVISLSQEAPTFR